MREKAENMNQLFTPGDMIGNYCSGFFGRNDYDNKTCVMVSSKFAVFVNEEGRATVLNWDDSLPDLVGGKYWKPIRDEDL